jgi:hypothetical protein
MRNLKCDRKYEKRISKYNNNKKYESRNPKQIRNSNDRNKRRLEHVVLQTLHHNALGEASKGVLRF